MKKPKRGRKRNEGCAGEKHQDDGVDPREFFKPPRRDKRSIKDLQLSNQVRQCLELVIEDHILDICPGGCMIYAVEPAPDATRMLVTVAVADKNRDAVRDRLAEVEVMGELRTEVAGAIHRKRTPELRFMVIPLEDS